MKVLLTGFAPFGAEKQNPSYEAVRLLPEEIAGASIIKAELPVVFRECGTVIGELLRREKPDAVILVGQAGGRTCISVERVAINCEDCAPDRPDNAGNAPQEQKVCPDGPDAYFSTLPIKRMVEKMLENGVPAQISNTAGTYVCNDAMYALLHQIHTAFPGVRGGFVHVPYATFQRHPQFASMTLEQISFGLRCCVEAAVEDLR